MTVYALGSVRPALGHDVWIAPSAAVIGDVAIGDDSSVWFGVVVRGDVYPIRIGARTNVQDNAVVHVTGDRSSTTIGDDVTIGHAAIVHGCTIGDLCLVGMGAIVLDDAVVGAQSFVAAGSLVPPRMQVPPRSFVRGRPARVLREVRADELDQMREAARVYVQGARRHRIELEES
jgi:carbonic anhydrase/acetyltransferase-like protein (isoleucine patch superfamily)